ncbi:site-specific integrase [Jiella pelagia]|nr:hypothetical protein [Jiella pelagia]
MRTIFAAAGPYRRGRRISDETDPDNRELTFRAAYRDLRERLSALRGHERMALDAANEIVRKLLVEDHPDWLADMSGSAMLHRALNEEEWHLITEKILDEDAVRRRFGLEPRITKSTPIDLLNQQMEKVENFIEFGRNYTMGTLENIEDVHIETRDALQRRIAEVHKLQSDAALSADRHTLALDTTKSDILTAINRRFSEMQATLSEGAFGHVADGAPRSRRSKRAPLFSEVSLQLQEDETKRSDGRNTAELNLLKRITSYFITLVGDRPIDRYTFDQIQSYVYDIAFIEPNVMKKYPDFTLNDLKEHIKKNRENHNIGLAEKTIRDAYLDRVKKIIKKGYLSINETSPFLGVVFRVHTDTPPPRERTAISAETAKEVLALSARSGVLSDVLLPLLGYLTGRRLAQLTDLRFEWFRREHSAWIVKPQGHVGTEDEKRKSKFKTNSALKKFVLNKVLEEIGLMDWIAQQKEGPVFHWLDQCANPAGAAQKRMTRLFLEAGCKSDDLETFHALRNTWISEASSKIAERVSRLQAGHELTDIHDRYKGQLKAVEVQAVYAMEPPHDIDLRAFQGLDWEALASKRPIGGRRGKAAIPASRRKAERAA